MTILELILLGCILGALSGFLSIGGGIVAVPALLLIDPTISIHEAISTSLHLMLISIAGSVVQHFKSQKEFMLEIIYQSWLLQIPLIVGAVFLAIALPDIVLKIILISLLTIGGFFRIAFFGRQSQYQIRSLKLSMCISSTMGALLGIGGAIFLVPWLRYKQISVKVALGAAALNTFLVSAMGVIVYQINTLISHSRILWVPIIVISITSPVIAYFCTKIAFTQIKPSTIDVIGTVMLFLSSSMVIYSSFFI